MVLLLQITEEQLLSQSCWCMGQLESALALLVSQQKTSFAGHSSWWCLSYLHSSFWAGVVEPGLSAWSWDLSSVSLS